MDFITWLSPKYSVWALEIPKPIKTVSVKRRVGNWESHDFKCKYHTHVSILAPASSTTQSRGIGSSSFTSGSYQKLHTTSWEYPSESEYSEQLELWKESQVFHIFSRLHECVYATWASWSLVQALRPHLDASIQVVPTSLQCEMRNVVMLTLCVSSYSEFDSLIHKTIYKPISTTPIYKHFGSQIPWSLTSRSVDGGTFNSCAKAFGKNGISWIHKVHQIHLWKGQSYYDDGFMFNAYIFCIRLHTLQCLSAGAIHQTKSKLPDST